MPSDSAAASATSLRERLLLMGVATAEPRPTVSPACADILRGTDAYGLSLLAAVAAPTAAQRRPTVLLWLDDVARRHFRWLRNDAANSATARRLFSWASRQVEKLGALRARRDAARNFSFHPVIGEKNVTGRHGPRMAYEDGVRWERRRSAWLEKERLRQAEEGEEVERACNRPWQMSPGTRRILRARDTAGRVDPVGSGKEASRQPGAASNSGALTHHYASRNSRRLTMDYPPLLERVRDDVAVRQQRAAQREEYARREPPALRLPPRQLAEQVSRLCRRVGAARESGFGGEVTFAPRINRGIFSPPSKPPGCTVIVASSFQQKRQARHGADAEAPLMPPGRAVPETQKAGPAISPIQTAAFCARQRAWEARRRGHIRRLSEELNARREEAHLAECTLHPTVNASSPSKVLNLEETRCLSMRVPFGALEQKSPTHRRLLHFEDISELCLRRSRLKKTPSSANASPFRVASRRSASPRGRAAPRTSPREARRCHAELHTPWVDAQKGRHLCNAVETSPAARRICATQQEAGGVPLELDGQTLFDLSVWWRDLITQQLQISFDAGAQGEDGAFDAHLYEWALESPFTRTLAPQTVVGALQELLCLSAGEPSAMALERRLGAEFLRIQAASQRDSGVTFAEFIGLYGKLLCRD
ncbi:uncharacterized protein Tco025E_09238 [Trypanosoma conorhini]|uniref:Uncharacterized protein n=1 Tax=Trypanosoma conorhini TaxID=83891 RepID=A0A3R7RBK5_9TRYP|nr:uncharacterized protein Tco025E_09238 [Trypanosoma conorhini]RNE99315.1 hypothetical protein Tco025E_09238 [Trypanosoma conorhini]